MRAFVFTDRALEGYAGRFVWLAVDTEKSNNTAFLAKYPIHVWPTLLVIDPKKESVIMRYAGGATVPQLSKLLDGAEKTYRSKSASPADKLLADAEKLSNDEKPGDAAKMYEQAIRKAPKNWPYLGRAAEAAVFQYTMAGDHAPCAALARELYPRLAGTVSGANIAATGLSCATSLKEDAADRAQLLAALERDTRESLENKKIPLSGDDRSGLYESLVDARETAKDEAGAKALREQWASFLEAQAAHAKTAEQRAVYDSHRLSVYLALGTPEKAIPMLEKSERDFPNDYNPPARLAVAYNALKMYNEALVASDRAMKRAYGPRKIVVYRTRADIYAAKGDKESARKTLEEAIRYAKSLPKEQVSDRTVASLEKKLAGLS
jgi:cellobiose-specific phosphotransferase system component IIA